MSDRYKTQEMCYKAVVNFLLTLNFVPDWFTTKELIKKLYTALFADDNILFFDEYSGNFTFATDEMDILCVNFNNIKLNDNLNFYC